MEFDVAALKQQGFFEQVDKGRFAVRLRISGGMADAALLRKAADIAERYGTGQVHLTARQQIEIPFVPGEHIQAIKDELAAAGIATAPGGARVRTIAACAGAAICKFGQIETGSLAKELQDRFGGRELPSKLKIALTGCANNCLKVETNDIGVRGYKKAYLLYFGGSFGRTIKIGQALLPELHDREAAIRVIGAALEFYAANALKGERLGTMLERTGPEAFQKHLEAAV
jgi:dissimilatory sulfite reductase (desulfoviridin) alpha/beta subunit